MRKLKNKSAPTGGNHCANFSRFYRGCQYKVRTEAEQYKNTIYICRLKSKMTALWAVRCIFPLFAQISGQYALQSAMWYAGQNAPKNLLMSFGILYTMAQDCRNTLTSPVSNLEDAILARISYRIAVKYIVTRNAKGFQGLQYRQLPLRNLLKSCSQVKINI